MKPINIILKNYKTYGDYETDLDLSGEGLKLIYGKSGAGKTSFFDGMVWCLFGESLCKVDEVINRKTKKNCKVEFNFLIGKDEYSVVRYRKHDDHGNKVFIFKNRKNISPLKSKECQDLIQGIIGMSHKALTSSVVFSSELYAPFLRSQGAQRLKIIEGVMSLKSILKWNDNVKKEQKKLLEKITNITTEIEKIEFGRKTIKDNLTQYLMNAREKNTNLNTEAEELKSKVSLLKNELDELNKIDIIKEMERIEVFEFNKNIKNQISELTKEIEDINNLILDKDKKSKKLKEIEEINIDEEIREIREYENQKKIYEEKKEKLRELEAQIKDTDSIKKQIVLLQSKIKTSEKELAILEEMICPKCSQKIPEELMDEINLLEKEKIKLEEANILLIEAKKNLETCEADNEETQKKINEIDLGTFNYTKFNYTIDELLDNRSSVERMKIEINHLEENIARADKSNKNINEKVVKLNHQLKELDKEPTLTKEFILNYSNEINDKNNEIVEKENRLKEIERELKNIIDKKYTDDLMNKMEVLKKAKEDKAKKLEKEERINKHYEFLLQFLSNNENGIKKFFINKMINKFNERINYFLPLFLDANVEITFDKNLNEKITVDDEEVSFDTFSSGEKSRMEVAISFALFMLVKGYFSHSINFAVFDEILDRNLDEDSLDRILDVIQSMAVGNLVLLISHRPDLRNKILNRIFVSKDKNEFSHITLE